MKKRAEIKCEWEVAIESSDHKEEDWWCWGWLKVVKAHFRQNLKMLIFFADNRVFEL